MKNPRADATGDLQVPTDDTTCTDTVATLAPALPTNITETHSIIAVQVFGLVLVPADRSAA